MKPIPFSIDYRVSPVCFIPKNLITLWFFFRNLNLLFVLLFINSKKTTVPYVTDQVMKVVGPPLHED